MNLFRIIGFLSIVILFTIILIFTFKLISKSKSFSNNTVKLKETKEPTIESTKEPTIKPTKTQNTNYKIIYETSKRYDGGKNYYVLIDKVDITNDKFISNIKEIIRKIIKHKGENISIELHDNRQSLDISYKQYGDNSLTRPLIEEEKQLKTRSFIAGYMGDMEIGIYLNTLMLFPCAFVDNPDIGKYHKTFEFNP
jgi:lipopolysaccharide export LptBFGC system permease protein LptF